MRTLEWWQKHGWNPTSTLMPCTVLMDIYYCIEIVWKKRVEEYVPGSSPNSNRKLYRLNNYDLLWFSCQHEALQDYSFHYCLLYLPPPSTIVVSYDATLLVDELISDIELFTNSGDNVVVCLVGDLNSLDHSRLETELGMSQIVRDITHGKRILDKFLTTHPDNVCGWGMYINSIYWAQSCYD